MSSPEISSGSLGSIFPEVGFPVTICVLCYGDNLPLADRFLSSLYSCTEQNSFSLRVGLNEVGKHTRHLFAEAGERLDNVSIFDEPVNVFKSPLMGKMFRSIPLDSEWLIWCDDDTCFTRPDWLHRLALKIQRFPHIAMWGQQYSLWRTDEMVLDWIRNASWFRHIPFMRSSNLQGVEATEFHFVTGGFWAIRTSVLKALNWPDNRLVQANDDFLLGEALRQNGYELGCFDYGVKINDHPRRNATAVEVESLRPNEEM